MEIETHLVKKVSKMTKVCTNCKNQIPPNEVYHKEEGLKKHLHSLIARRFCNECYSKYGEKKLLVGN